MWNKDFNDNISKKRNITLFYRTKTQEGDIFDQKPLFYMPIVSYILAGEICFGITNVLLNSNSETYDDLYS